MKKLLLTLVCLPFLGFSQYLITTDDSTMQFVPDTITCNIGDTVIFQLSSMHNAVEVSESAWIASLATNPIAWGINISYGDTATFVAECVRAGIQGIGKGQKEAAASIGLTPNQILKLVVMPQALRIIIPPTTNQYLNLTKNSSLAAAIAYPDLVLVFAGTALMQTGKAIEIVSITMLTYLSISLAIAAIMNWYNKKIEIKEK